MYGACESKDQILKKSRTFTFSRQKIGTPQTGRLLNRAFGPSRNSIRHSLDVCHTEIASHRHFPGGFVKTSATVEISASAIRTDLDRLITPSLLPQSGTCLKMQHRWQIRGCKLQCNDVVDEDEGDTAHCGCQWCCVYLKFGRKHRL